MGIFDMFNQWRKHELSPNLRPRSQKKNKHKKKKDIDPEKARIIRKLKHRTKYLDLEYKDTQEEMHTAKTSFFTAIAEYCSKNPDSKNPLVPSNTDSSDATQDEYEFPEDLKTIYREIVMATHPDKHPGDEDLKQICISATQAKKDKKVEDLINLSFDLDIDISNISIDLIEKIERALDEKQKEIEKMRKNNAMVWFYAAPEQQEVIIKHICPKEKE
jgi:hypothetical protein